MLSCGTLNCALDMTLSFSSLSLSLTHTHTLDTSIKSETPLLNNYQLQLEQSFAVCHYPDRPTVKDLAHQLDVQEATIEV